MGWGFASFPDGADTALTNLFDTANSDPRIATAYTTALQPWKSNGGQMVMIFSDIGRWSQYGEWGLIQSIMQTITPLSSAPPKWQAVQDFISNFFFSSRRRHTRWTGDWSSDVCSSD